jgi:hypothetical protein
LLLGLAEALDDRCHRAGKLIVQAHGPSTRSSAATPERWRDRLDSRVGFVWMG